MNSNRTPFPHERLDVYRLALVFIDEVETVVRAMPVGHGDLVRQLRRASAGIALNIAEGAGRGHHKDKANRFTIARGECGECATALDIGCIRRAVDRGTKERLKDCARRMAAMLTGLIRRERRLAAKSKREAP